MSTVNAALEAAEVIKYPVILRAAFTLGGLGSGFANNPDELRDLAAKGLSLSPQVLIERSMKGWKELEYEVVRDGADVCLTSCRLINGIDDMVRILLFAATWRTLTLWEHTLATLSLLRLHKRYLMTSTICCEVLL